MNLLKSRWLKLETDLSGRNIFELISEKRYTPDSMSGFIDINYISNVVEATYVEKVTITQYIIDPFGVETEQTLHSYNHVEFRIIEANYIEIVRPPRSVSNFISFLTKMSSHKLFISMLKIDLNNALSNAMNTADSILIKKAKVSGLRMGTNGIASVEIKSSVNALEDLREVSQDPKRSLDKISGIAKVKSGKFEFEVTKQGYISCEEDYHQEMVDMFVTNTSSY